MKIRWFLLILVIALMAAGCSRQPNLLLGSWLDKANDTVWEFKKNGELLMTRQDLLNGVTVKYKIVDDQTVELTFFAETSNAIHGQASYKFDEEILVIKFTEMGSLSGTTFKLRKIVEEK